MPGFDGTGPAGGGSMTGWGRGNCVVAQNQGGGSSAGYGRRGQGRGGRGMGRGFGYGFRARSIQYSQQQPLSKEDEIAMLRSEAEALKSELNEIASRLSDLDQ